jgi:hypothetical protein
LADDHSSQQTPMNAAETCTFDASRIRLSRYLTNECLRWRTHGRSSLELRLTSTSSRCKLLVRWLFVGQLVDGTFKFETRSESALRRLNFKERPASKSESGRPVTLYLNFEWKPLSSTLQTQKIPGYRRRQHIIQVFTQL